MKWFPARLACGGFLLPSAKDKVKVHPLVVENVMVALLRLKLFGSLALEGPSDGPLCFPTMFLVKAHGDGALRSLCLELQIVNRFLKITVGCVLRPVRTVLPVLA